MNERKNTNNSSGAPEFPGIPSQQSTGPSPISTQKEIFDSITSCEHFS